MSKERQPRSASPAKTGVYAFFAKAKKKQQLMHRYALRRGSPPPRGRRLENRNTSIKMACYLCFSSLLLLLLGCSIGPDYVRPDVDIPTTYKEGPSHAWKTATPQDIIDRGQWWQIFNDPDLNHLEEQATAANQSIAVAQAQYLQALAIVDKAKAEFFPTLSGSIGDEKSRSQPLNSTGTSLSTTGKPFNAASLGLQATWEIDLWGNIHRLVEADEAAAQASAAEVSAVRLSIQATVAQTYFQLRALDEAQIMLDESVTAYEKFLNITRNQYKSGTASQLAILQADAQLQAIKVLAIDNSIARTQHEHAIAVLTNHPPAHFSIPRKARPLIPPQIPLEVPSVLLERRPDIANAERLMAQANAQIGVATSAFFPLLTLSGSRTYQKKSFSHLLSGPSILWSLGAQLTVTIIDGGSRRAAIHAADAAYHASVATYRQIVLSAFQDVEDNLSTLQILNHEQMAQNSAVRATQKQLTYTMNEYKSGTASSLTVLNALFNVYIAKRSAINISGRQMVAAVGLIKALGGGLSKGAISS